MILVIDNYDSFVYNLVHYVEDFGVATEVVRNDALTVDAALKRQAKAIILSPGPCTPNEAGICLPLLAQAPADLPILGVCLGHQAMGQAFGGNVVSARAIMHGKVSDIRHSGRGLFKGLPSPFKATRYHSLAVAREGFPEAFSIDAETGDGEVMGMSHKSRPLYGVQFHPESIASEHGHAMIGNFLEAAVQERAAMSARDADFAAILDGKASHAEIMDFLARSLAWMGDPQALAAGARAMRERMLRVNAPEGAIDVCGTGGDGAHTLNISTAVAFVVAGAGVPVAKHGNRAMSSKSGAADVLEALGVKLTADLPTLERCLREARLAFLFAQNHHPALRHVAAARREIGARTIFNLLGPLANPAGVTRQLLGVFAPDFVAPIAHALQQLGCERALVVHGAGGVDELSATRPNTIAELAGGRVATHMADTSGPVDEGLHGGDAKANAHALEALLDGGGRAAYRQAVLANAAAALRIAGLEDGPERAAASLDSGAAKHALQTLIAITRAAP
jgi:anthranilate phosphoribosyltransferase